MSIDFRADQIRTNKIIASGSTGTNAKLLIYPVSASSDLQGGIDATKFASTGIGSDVFMFVSGAVSSIGTSIPGTTVFGGDVYISGNLQLSGSIGFDTTLTNNTGGTLNAGTPVYISGSGQIAKSQANASATAIVFGIVVSAINNGSSGLVRYGGSVYIPPAAQTGTWVAGDTIYLDDITAGKLTNIAPSSSTTYILEVGQLATSPSGGTALLYLMKTSRIYVP